MDDLTAPDDRRVDPQAGEFAEVTDPVLDLDAMLADLHADFPDPTPPSSDVDPGDVESEGEDDDGDRVAPVDTSTPPPESNLLPPGMVEFGGEIMSETEARALLQLNRLVKEDPGKAAAVRDAVLGQQQQPRPDAWQTEIPDFIDRDDPQAVYLFQQQAAIRAQLDELRQMEAKRQQDFAVQQAETRKQQVISAFRRTIDRFQKDHPEFEQEDVKNLVNAAASMRLLEAPETLDPDGSLEGGMLRALDTAMWGTPEYREKALAGDTIRTKAEKSADRKHKSSALSSSTGSTPRNQSGDQKPVDRSTLMKNMLADLRAGLSD
jgi:hypothetical protein